MSINPKKTQDMSIEEILKSIRGVISKHEEPQNNEEVLELTNVVDDSGEIDESNDCNDSDKSTQDQYHDHEQTDEHLISEATFQETAESLKDFAHKAKYAAKTAQSPKALTIDKMVEQMMRPQLKEWLDKNLPSLVRELVEKEIKRLIPDIDEEE